MRIAIVGAGLFVQDAHLPALLELPGDYRVVAIAARRRETAAHMAALVSSGAEATDDVGALLERPDIDAIDIAVPMGATADLVRKALAAGKHVFSEKPIAVDGVIARELVALHRGNPGQVWMVGENWRIEPAFVRAAALVAAGEIGRPRIAQWTNFAALNAGDRYYSTEWRRSAHGAGLIVDGGVHHAAVMRLVLGEVASVTATVALQRQDLPPYDTAAATIAFRSGAIGGYLVTYGWPAPWPSPLFVVGESGTIKVDTRSLELTNASGTRVQSFASEYFAVKDEFRLFAEAVRAGRLALNTPEEALADLAVVEAIIRSAASGAATAVAE